LVTAVTTTAVSKIIEKAYEKAKEILSANKDKLDRLAQRLLEKEVIFKDDLEEILGARQWADRHVPEQAVTDTGAPL
jgi:cell division protease FtsH